MKLLAAFGRNDYMRLVMLFFVICISVSGQSTPDPGTNSTLTVSQKATNLPVYIADDPSWKESNCGLSLRCKFEKEKFGLWEPINTALEVKIDKAVFQGKFSTKHISLCSRGEINYYCNFGQEDYRQIILLSDNNEESMYRIWFNCKYDYGFVPPINQMCDVSFIYVIDNKEGEFPTSNSVRIIVPLERKLEMVFYIEEILRNSESRRPACGDLCEWLCLCYPISNLKEFGTNAQIELEKRFYEEIVQENKEILLKAILCFEKDPRLKLSEMQTKADSNDKAIITWVLNQYDKK